MSLHGSRHHQSQHEPAQQVASAHTTSFANPGHVRRLAQAVNKHGVIFISSAGNAGPALSTVGAPGGTASSIISIGAYVSPAMAAASHSVRGTMPEVQLPHD